MSISSPVFQPLIPSAAQTYGASGFGGDGGVGLNSKGNVKVWMSSTWAVKPVKYWDGSTWTQKTLRYWSGTAWVPSTGGIGRGLFMGGATTSTPTFTDTVDYITFASPGTAVDFGNLSAARGQYSSGCASSVIGVIMGGTESGPTDVNTMEYFTIAATGNATDFGNLSGTYSYTAALSNSTKGVNAGGYYNSGGRVKTMEYILFASTGNSTYFGDLFAATARENPTGASSPTRGIFANGWSWSAGDVVHDDMDYIDVTSTGNASDFGNLSVARFNAGGCASATRGVWAGGEDVTSSPLDVIDYVEFATTGNATDFGNLTSLFDPMAACSSATLGCFGGGYDGNYLTKIDQITISSAGNATSFGNLSVARRTGGACSDVHGGL